MQNRQRTVIVLGGAVVSWIGHKYAGTIIVDVMADLTVAVGIALVVAVMVSGPEVES